MIAAVHRVGGTDRELAHLRGDENARETDQGSVVGMIAAVVRLGLIDTFPAALPPVEHAKMTTRQRRHALARLLAEGNAHDHEGAPTMTTVIDRPPDAVLEMTTERRRRGTVNEIRTRRKSATVFRLSFATSVICHVDEHGMRTAIGQVISIGTFQAANACVRETSLLDVVREAAAGTGTEVVIEGNVLESVAAIASEIALGEPVGNVEIAGSVETVGSGGQARACWTKQPRKRTKRQTRARVEKVFQDRADVVREQVSCSPTADQRS